MVKCNNKTHVRHAHSESSPLYHHSVMPIGRQKPTKGENLNRQAFHGVN